MPNKVFSLPANSVGAPAVFAVKCRTRLANPAAATVSIRFLMLIYNSFYVIYCNHVFIIDAQK